MDNQEAALGYETWYACDGCHCAINAGHYRFDCGTCDNFTFCERCYKKNTKHLHKFKRVKTAQDLVPPENSVNLIAQSYMLCSECKDCLIEQSKRVYICHECSPDITKGEIIYWCKTCKDKTEHEHKRSKFKGIPGLTYDENEEAGEGGEGKKSKYLDNLLQEYYDLDCEDLIGGGSVKSRFKYTTVAKENYGLTEEEIFLLDDKQLNKLVSMKNLRPYKHLDENGNVIPEERLKKYKPNEYKIRKLKADFKDEME